MRLAQRAGRRASQWYAICLAGSLFALPWAAHGGAPYTGTILAWLGLAGVVILGILIVVNVVLVPRVVWLSIRSLSSGSGAQPVPRLMSE